MLSAQVFCSFVLLATLAISSASMSVPEQAPPPGCRPGLIVDCASTNDTALIVWSKDENNVCRPITNSCWYNQENCRRYRQGRPLLQKIPKQECQLLCVKDCSETSNETICGSYNGTYCTFSNQCEWSRHLCTTGEIYRQEPPLSCGANPQPCVSTKR